MTPQNTTNGVNSTNEAGEKLLNGRNQPPCWVIPARITGGVLALCSVVFAISLRGMKRKSCCEDILIGVWVVGPPIYMIFEWAFGAYGPLEEFKYSQELATKVWLSLVSLLVCILKRKWLFGS